MKINWIFFSLYLEISSIIFYWWIIVLVFVRIIREICLGHTSLDFVRNELLFYLSFLLISYPARWALSLSLDWIEFKEKWNISHQNGCLFHHCPFMVWMCMCCDCKQHFMTMQCQFQYILNEYIYVLVYNKKKICPCTILKISFEFAGKKKELPVEVDW